jgi:hypothetical protein
LSRLSILRRWSTAVNSVETAPPTFWVGESGGVGEGRIVEDVVAPARLLDLLGQLLVLLARLGRGRLGCFHGSHLAGSHRHGEQSPIWQAELSERPGWTPWRLAESWARPDLR